MKDPGRYLAFWPMPRGRANRCIDAGDACRDAGRWREAAAHYRRAVEIQPKRRPIWIQLGHMEKEAGRPEAALEAYRRASQLPGTDGEAFYHHGLLARALGKFLLAKASFAQAFRENPDHAGVRTEWQHTLHHPLAASDADKAIADRLLDAEQTRLARIAEHPSRLVFEITDLLRHFRHARLPTGVQRVQAEIVHAALKLHPGSRICTFTGRDQGWALVPVDHFLTLRDLAMKGSDLFDAAWIDAVEVLTGVVAVNRPVGFGPGDTLINLGTSWSLPDYFLHVRNARRTHGMAHVPFLHDLIPVFAPEYCLPDVVSDFLNWIGGIFDHADHFLTNSHSTAGDLAQVGRRLGREPAHEAITVVRLDAAAPGNVDEIPVGDTLDRCGVKAGDYILFVASIEPRKNHLMAFRAWTAMLARGMDDVPTLVCVGHGGWLNDPIYAMLHSDAALAAKVRILSDISDGELAQLYRHCRFTIYPSHYEGWGMPVTESLCHGKVPILTRNSSLTEAGGDFALYVEPDDHAALATAITQLWNDRIRLKELEDRIARDFHPRSWNDLAAQVCDAVHTLPSARAHKASPVEPDRIYRMGSHRSAYLMPGAGAGAMLRQGSGWYPPEEGTVRTRPQGGEISLFVEKDMSPAICHLHLMEYDPGTFAVRTTQDRDLTVRTEGPPGWLSFEMPLTDQQATIRLSGGIALSHLIISDAPELAQILTRIIRDAASEYAFLRDIHPILVGKEVDPENLAKFLPSLETGGLRRTEVVEILQKRRRRQAPA